MFSKEAIQELTKAAAIAAAANAINGRSDDDIVALPQDFCVTDLEKYGLYRRRARGSMMTSEVLSLAAYVAKQAEEGATVFVDQNAMRAVAVLNLGLPGEPGHADHTATFVPVKTAAYESLLEATKRTMTQSALAEWLEDWSDHIGCTRDGESIDTPRAIAAVRAITVEQARRVESVEKQLSAEKSLFESVKADSNGNLPTMVAFACEPMHGFVRRVFLLRLAVHPADKQVTLGLRMVKQEQHAEEMARELAAMVADHISGNVPVLLGTYKAAA